LASWVDQDPLDIYDSNTMFKTIPAFAHGGSFHKFLVNTAHISESHYRAAKKDGSFVYPVAIATYMRWCRTVERTSVGSVIEFVLKASDKWEHAPHLASMPLLESMVSQSTQDQ
jgi:hypothetical protein